MTPFPLPTDNLYKFCALSGLVLIILSIYAPIKNLNEIDLQLIEIDYQDRLYHLKEEDAQIRAEEGLLDDVEVRLLANERAQDLMKNLYLTEKAAALLAQAKLLVKRMYFGIGIGLMLFTFGFGRWYLRIQKPADDQVRAAMKDES